MAAVASIPSTHAAWVFTKHGPPTEVLTLRTDHPTPTPASLRTGEALIKVSAVSTNAGFLLAINSFPHPTSHPWIPEIEFAGTIVALGPRGANQEQGQGQGEGAAFQVGDRVLGTRTFPSMLKYNGALQAYLVSPVSLLVQKPDSISMIDASGLSGVGCTALQSLEVAGVKPGHKVLVTGASGGLGSILVQTAKAVVGETGVVVTTCSGKNIDLVKSLGADEVVDYTAHDPLHTYFEKHHSSAPFDAIFDVAGTSNTLYTASPSYLTKSGIYIQLGAIHLTEGAWLSIISGFFTILLNRLLPTILGGTPRRFLFYSATPNQKDSKKVIELAEQGKIKAVVDSVWKVEDVKKAYERAVSHRARGKIVIDFD
ncbi:hypothetical protein A1O3_09686 [Capronia epimyces CBS 606.96]|uniref:Enoyl reductase (ER) domain-containing protein n=1 Tax=Capronia epimyces CBS 606.96 TaxID=1182542 RepID=W9XJE8_9EURO|nr:uncharacterized protein A1O3_09686 [Capronia epimyces CBS 606.96]EXJ77460.1 hypothetical protein A1O3_09686 [Capronia epimyces CBS 606.96]